MAVYRQVHISFWQDPFISELTPEEKYFYLYLMTNSKTKQCGAYEISKKIMTFETGYNLETVDKLLQRFIDYGKIEYNNETNEILLKNWLKYNTSKSPKVIACIKKEAGELKNKPYADFVIEYLYSIKKTDTVSIDSGEEKEEEEEKEETKEEEKEATTAERECLNILKAIHNYPFNFTEDLDYLRVLIVDFPQIDLLAELKKWRDYKRDKPLKPKANPRLQLRNWCEKAVEYGRTKDPEQRGPMHR